MHIYIPIQSKNCISRVQEIMREQSSMTCFPAPPFPNKSDFHTEEKSIVRMYITFAT